MSLFKAREWWSCKAGTDETYDYGCIKVGIFNEDTNSKIVVGSHSGVLRIYNPIHRDELSDKSITNYASDLLLEKSLNSSIIQVEIGKFVSTSTLDHIAILFSQKLSVFQLTEQSGVTEHGRQYELELNYEHNLNRPAFNMCKGQFGGGKSKRDDAREYICVQSVDGVLFVFEFERNSMVKSIPGCYLAGPICYLPRQDAFITAASNWHIECYKYQTLAISSDQGDKRDLEASGTTSSRRVLPEWSFNIGESALSIKISKTKNAYSILCLGERNLFCLNDHGQLLFMKKFEYNPSTFITYETDQNNDGIRYIIGTHSRTLFINHDSNIKWAAHVEQVPVQLEICTIQGIRGMICSLSEFGDVQCYYLGTDPVSTTMPLTSSSRIDVSDAEQGLMKLQKEIKLAMNDPSLVVKRKSNAKMTISVEMPSEKNSFSMADEIQFQDSDPVPSLTVKVQLRSSEAVQNVLLNIHCHTPICAKPNEIRFGSMGISPVQTEVTFWMKDDLTPTSLDVTLTVTFNTSDKLSENGQNNLISGRYFGTGGNVSVMASKSSQKYRFQSDSLANIWLFSQFLIERLSSTNSSIEFEYGEPLPYSDYFEIIDRHYELRIECEKINEMIDVCSKQFRAIQKRLLNKFKDKTPTLLDNLDVLLENTHHQIVALADHYEQIHLELHNCSHQLSCATKLINLLLKISVNMSNDDERLLNSILTPIVNDDNEQGWEEYVDASLTFALRTMLSRSSTKGDLIPASSATFNNSTLNIDVTKLKKRIQMFCDRLEKGASLTSNSSSVTFEEKNHDDHQVPKKKNIINGVKPVVQHRDVPSYDNNDQMENKLLPMNEQHSDYDDET